MKVFGPAFRVSTREQSQRLCTHLKLTWGALFGRRDYHSANPSLVMDHGWVLRWVRDLLTLLGITCRLAIGLFGILLILVCFPILALVRLSAIPLVALTQAYRLSREIRKIKGDSGE